MYLLLNGYKSFIFINRSFHKDSFKIETYVLFLFLDKVVNCSDFFVLAILGCPRGTLTSVVPSWFLFFQNKRGIDSGEWVNPIKRPPPIQQPLFQDHDVFDSQAL